jgi:hypothetical protein
VNTQWVDRSRSWDLFDEPGGAQTWLTEHQLPGGVELTETPVRQARAALRGVLERPGELSEEELNAVLGRGAVHYALRRRYAARISRRRRRMATGLAGRQHVLPSTARSKSATAT